MKAQSNRRSGRAEGFNTLKLRPKSDRILLRRSRIMHSSEPKPSASPEAKQILRGLTSRQIGQRLAVERQLLQMGPQAAELLLEILGEEARKRRTKRRLFWTLLGGGLSAAAALAIAILVSGHPEALGILGTFGGLGGLSALWVPSQRYFIVINALSRLDDVRAVGPLAEAFFISDLNVRTEVARALMRLLPRLQPTDAEWLNATQRAALQRVLKTGKPDTETDFMLVVLEALTTIEDVNALPAMEALARSAAGTDNERRIQEAAAQCVPRLEAVRDRLQTTRTLLRASAAETAPEQLLRAAQSAGETPPQQLLRAGPSQDEG
jgi:HEAT repeat protein